MKITRTETTYDAFGRFGFMIETGEDGTTADVTKQAIHFNNVFITGKDYEDPMRHGMVLKEYIKKILRSRTKEKEDISIYIYTNGMIKPPIGMPIRTRYVVCLNTKASGIDYEKRIIGKTIQAYNELEETPFVFNLTHIDEIDEIKMLVDEYKINPKHVWIRYYNDELIKDVMETIKFFGFNIIRGLI